MMRLFRKTSADESIKKQTQELLEKNHRLRRFLDKGIKELNSLKDGYSQDKIRAEKEFNDFVNSFILKKSKMLEELSSLQREIEEKKDIIHALTLRRDRLDEREFELDERDKRIDLREDFVSEIENKISNSTQ